MNDFEANTINIYKEHGKQWLKCLPETVKKIAEEQNLFGLIPMPNLSHNYVMSGVQNNQQIILKIGIDVNALNKEAEALKAFGKHGSIKVIAQGEGMLILEHAKPGTSLKSYWPDRDNEATKIAAQIIKKLHKTQIPKQHSFPTIIDWLTALDRGEGIPEIYLQKARFLKSQLISTCSEFKLLHGDLHHYNILKHGKKWIVIDPKGIIGESAYEIAYYIRNPIPELIDHRNTELFVKNRIDQFAKIFNISQQRILYWCFVQAVLAWVWSLEDGCNVEHFERITKILHAITRIK